MKTNKPEFMGLEKLIVKLLIENVLRTHKKNPSLYRNIEETKRTAKENTVDNNIITEKEFNKLWEETIKKENRNE